MEVFKIAKDAVNEVIVINVVHADYKDLVQKRVNQKTPSATIKGFKKGKAPKDLVAKQYGFTFKIEEVNLLVNQQLEKFIKEENINMLGTPLLINNPDFTWEADTLVFEHEIGLVPKFELTLENINATKYNVVASEELIDSQINRIRKQFGTLSPADVVKVDSEIEATFKNIALDIDAIQTFALSAFQNQEIKDLFIGKKVADTFTLNASTLFDSDDKIKDFLYLDEETFTSLDFEITAEIINISSVQDAALDQDLFNKVYGEGKVNSEEEMRNTIKTEAEQYFVEQANQKLTQDVIAATIEANNIPLPAEFLTRWLKTAGETTLSDAEAAIEYQKSANSLRYQLIEEKLTGMNDYRITFEDLKAHASNTIRLQMQQYGYGNATDEEVQSIVAKTLSNQDEVQRISRAVYKVKTLEFLVSKANLTEKEVTFEEFIKESYGA